MARTLTQERLKELFEYRDGMIFWRVKPAKQIPLGARAGCISSGDNHRYVRFDGKLRPEARIIYMLFYGVIDDTTLIDHKDCNPLNNHIGNLRTATHSQNLCNRGKSKVNTSGYKGVTYDKRERKWAAGIVFMGKRKSLGTHKTPELAHEAYKKAAIELHGEFANY